MQCFSESNGCLTSEGFCHHSCVRTAAGFSCACKTGFMLDSNSVTCTGNLHRNVWLLDNKPGADMSTKCWQQIVGLTSLLQLVQQVAKSLLSQQLVDKMYVCPCTLVCNDDEKSWSILYPYY